MAVVAVETVVVRAADHQEADHAEAVRRQTAVVQAVVVLAEDPLRAADHHQTAVEAVHHRTVVEVIHHQVVVEAVHHRIAEEVIRPLAVEEAAHHQAAVEALPEVENLHQVVVDQAVHQAPLLLVEGHVENQLAAVEVLPAAAQAEEVQAEPVLVVEIAPEDVNHPHHLLLPANHPAAEENQLAAADS